jgi:Holliday junction resolvasome RuvABC endonuclease subunit
VSFAIERQYSDKNPQSAFVLVSFYSIFLLLSESLNVKCVGMLPTQVKKIISGDGLCNKDFLRMALERQFGILIDAFSHDETDAIAIALAALLDYKE